VKVASVQQKRPLAQPLITLVKGHPTLLSLFHQNGTGLVMQSRIRGKGNRLLMNRRVHIDMIQMIPGQLPLRLGCLNGSLEELLHPLRTDPVSPFDQLRRQGMLKIIESIEVLPISGRDSPKNG